MKKFLFLPLFFISFQLSAQGFSKVFAPNMLFTKVTDFGYEDSYPYWSVKKIAVSLAGATDSVIQHELIGFTAKGDAEFKLLLQEAEYCDLCGEMRCEYNGIQFVLSGKIRNDSVDWEKN